jgi:hypothetical protein
MWNLEWTMTQHLVILPPARAGWRKRPTIAFATESQTETQGTSPSRPQTSAPIAVVATGELAVSLAAALRYLANKTAQSPVTVPIAKTCAV